MNRRGRQLLHEVLGDKKFQTYEEGDWIGVKSPDGYEYFAKKGRFHIPIKRKKIGEPPKQEEVGEEDDHLPDDFGDYYHTLPNRIWNVTINYGNKTEMGKLNGNDLYDAVATYVQSAKLGKLEWKCGNIDIDLPNNMPPQDTSVTTFIKRGLRKTGIGLYRLPRNYIRTIITIDLPIVILCVPLGFLGMTILSLFVDSFIVNVSVNSLLIGYFTWALFFTFHSGYLRWKNQWEVNGE